MKKSLNLYAGIGGNRKKWNGTKVTAVEMNTQIADVYRQQYPADDVVIGDAHKYLIEHYREFDFIWSSPPCQTHSRMAKGTRHQNRKYPDMALYQEVIFLQHFFKGLWVVENVKPYYEPLIQPTAVIGRHYFWANFEIAPFDISNHPNFIKSATSAETESLKAWLGIDYPGNIYYDGNHDPGQVLRNCVHPSLGEHVFLCAQHRLHMDAGDSAAQRALSQPVILSTAEAGTTPALRQ